MGVLFRTLSNNCFINMGGQFYMVPHCNAFEPQHEISNKVVCATSKASYQPAHTRSLIRAFASRLNTL